MALGCIAGGNTEARRVEQREAGADVWLGRDMMPGDSRNRRWPRAGVDG